MTAAGKLPVWATVLASWRYLATQWRIVLPLAALLLLTGPASVFWQPVMVEARNLFRALPNLWYSVADVLTGLPLLILAALAIVPLHRAILTEPPQSARRIPFRLGRREIRYFMFLILLGVFYTGFDLAIMLTTGSIIRALLDLRSTAQHYGPISDLIVPVAVYITAIPLIAVFTYFMFRLSLALPAISTDRERPLSHAWTLSLANGWRLFSVMWVAVLPVLAVALLFQPPSHNAVVFIQITTDGRRNFLPGGSGVGPSFTLVEVWVALTYTAVFLIEGAALSMSYRALGGMEEVPTAT